MRCISFDVIHFDVTSKDIWYMIKPEKLFIYLFFMYYLPIRLPA